MANQYNYNLGWNNWSALAANVEFSNQNLPVYQCPSDGRVMQYPA